MKVRIVKSKHTWYDTRIGYVYNVEVYSGIDSITATLQHKDKIYRIIEPGPLYFNYLFKEDCITLLEEKLKRICHES